ncbi:MAG: hypothetical protein WC501_01410 [Candidatus Micrarchaeia archaeon]
MKKIFFIFILCFSISNSAILRWEDSCSLSDPAVTDCYYQVAASYAFVGNSQKAIEYCNKIVDGVYDIDSFEYGIRNSCYKDIAKKLGKLDICDMISEEEYKQQKEICIAETTNEIYRKNQSMKCSFLYIIGFALFGSFFFR